MRVSKRDTGGTAFADCVWKPVVLIEMKKRGENLQKYYRQAFDYWTRLVPNRPRYVVLCNFDEFRVYDFDTALDTAVLTAYGFNPKRDLLTQLLALNQAVAATIESGESVTAPGVPKNYPDAKQLVTADCIRPQVLV